MRARTPCGVRDLCAAGCPSCAFSYFIRGIGFVGPQTPPAPRLPRHLCCTPVDERRGRRGRVTVHGPIHVEDAVLPTVQRARLRRYCQVTAASPDIRSNMPNAEVGFPRCDINLTAAARGIKTPVVTWAEPCARRPQPACGRDPPTSAARRAPRCRSAICCRPPQCRPGDRPGDLKFPR